LIREKEKGIRKITIRRLCNLPPRLLPNPKEFPQYTKTFRVKFCTQSKRWGVLDEYDRLWKIWRCFPILENQSMDVLEWARPFSQRPWSCSSLEFSFNSFSNPFKLNFCILSLSPCITLSQNSMSFTNKIKQNALKQGQTHVQNYTITSLSLWRKMRTSNRIKIWPLKM